jgi:peptidoglycan/LPS O-acetylase OafA/YrhL
LQTHISAYTALRFFAATAVVIFHYGTHLLPIGSPLTSLLRKGNLAVSFFYFLSGVVLYIAYHQRNFTRLTFYRKRMERIYPTYLIALLVTLVLAMLLQNQFPSIGTFLVHGLAFQSWTPDHVLAINTPGWSISVEFFFYILFPNLLAYSLKTKLLNYSLLVGAVWFISIVLFQHQITQTPSVNQLHFLAYSPIYHVATFIFGMLSGRIICHYPKILPPLWNRIVWFSSLCVIISILLWSTPLTVLGHNGLFAPLYGALLFGLANESATFTRLSNNPITNHLGKISFSMYLFQYPVYMVFAYLFQSELTALQFGTYFLALLILSHFSYRYIESPQIYIKKLAFAKSVFK